MALVWPESVNGTHDPQNVVSEVNGLVNLLSGPRGEMTGEQPADAVRNAENSGFLYVDAIRARDNGVWRLFLGLSNPGRYGWYRSRGHRQ